MKKYIVFIVITAVIIFTVCGCGGLPFGNCLEYRSEPFKLDGKLDCEGREYTLAIEYAADETLTARVSEPARIAGCTVTLAPDGGAALTFGGITVNIAGAEDILSYGALAALRELVLPPEEGLLSVKVIKLGNRRYNLAVFETRRGKVSVWFDSTGKPARFEADDLTLSVTAFNKQPADGTDNSLTE